MSTDPSISVVVATYNRRDVLPAFLSALLADPALTEVVVAVDGSDDGSFELAQELQRNDSRITPLWVDHQGQFGALDAGARAAVGEVVLFMDDDVIAAPDMVERHVAHHARRDGLVVLGYMPPALDARPAASEFATVLYAPEYERRCRAYEADSAEVLLFLWGGNFSLRRSDYLELGYSPLEAPPGSPPLRMYNQDRDFGLRCRAAGLEGVFDRSIRAVHRHQRAVDGFLRDAVGQGACEVLLHHLHPESLGPFGLDRYSEGLPAPLRRLVETVGVDGVGGERAEQLGSLAVRAGARTGSVRSTVLAAKIARRTQQRRGAELMLRLLDADAGSMTERSSRPG